MSYISYFLLALFGLLSLSGLLVQHSSLFGYPLDESDEALVRSKTPLGKLLISFSPDRNISKLLFSSPPKDKDLEVLNGIRVLGMVWVILGHAYLTPILFPVNNIMFIENHLKGVLFPLIPGAFFAVDIFFFLSAFLATYLMVDKFRNMERLNLGTVLQIYFHRIYRLIPFIALMTIFTIGFVGKLGSGPLWVQGGVVDQLGAQCKSDWWANFLFINNLTHQGCISWVWYLANDMQFFIFMPFIVYAFTRKRILGYSILVFLVGFNLLLSTILAFHYEVDPNPFLGQYFAEMYQKPWV